MGWFTKNKTENINSKMADAYNVRARAGDMSAAMGAFFGNAFSGQTISGGMDLPEVTTLDYFTLRERSWSAMAKDELASMIIRRLVLFVSGTGLKLQAEPMFDYLEHYNIKYSEESRRGFVKFIEESYRLQSKSKIMSNTSKEKTLHRLISTAFFNAIVGGDVLVILNVIDGYAKIQLVDGANISDPSFLGNSSESGIDVIFNGNKTTRKIPPGNKIKNGVEIDKDGCHVGYYVMQFSETPSFSNIDISKITPVFIPAYGEETGRRTAWMLYGNEYRLGETRGMPILGVTLEKAQLLRRYSRAEVMNAEISAKIVGFIQHEESSTGLNPMQPRVVNRNRNGVAPVIEQGYSKLSGDEIAQNFTKMTGGQFVNGGRGQKLVTFDTARPPANYGEFYDSNAKYICAALDVPWEVALMVFTNNFSASRMAAKLFEGGALAKWRQELNDNMYRPHYNMFFTLVVLQNNLRAPKYFESLMNNNQLIIDAYSNSRFIGKAMPHVDPLKEAKTITELMKNGVRSMTAMVEETYGEDYEDTIPAIAKENELRLKNNIFPEDSESQNEGRNNNDNMGETKNDSKK